MYAPRNYVLIGVKIGGTMVDTAYNSALATMFAPRKPTQNTMRKMFINHWHRKELSTGILKDIAFRMRHSLFVAMESYRKINLGGEIKPLPFEPSKLVAKPVVVIPILAMSEPEVIPILPKPAEVKLAPVREPHVYFNPVMYNREYRKENAEKLNEKQRKKYNERKEEMLLAKMLRKLNLGQTTKPTLGSLEKYGLFQDRWSGKWGTRIVGNVD